MVISELCGRAIFGLMELTLALLASGHPHLPAAHRPHQVPRGARNILQMLAVKAQHRDQHLIGTERQLTVRLGQMRTHRQRQQTGARNSRMARDAQLV